MGASPSPKHVSLVATPGIILGTLAGLALYLVARHLGTAVAQAVAKFFAFDLHADSMEAYAVFPPASTTVMRRSNMPSTGLPDTWRATRR